MIYKIKKITLISLATVSSILHVIAGIVFGLVIAVGSMSNQETEGLWSLGPWAVLVIPIVNGFIGFLTGLFIAGVYNMIAGFLGKCIEFEVEEI